MNIIHQTVLPIAGKLYYTVLKKIYYFMFSVITDNLCTIFVQVHVGRTLWWKWRIVEILAG